MSVLAQAKRNAPALLVGAVLFQGAIMLCTGVAQWIGAPRHTGGFALFSFACMALYFGAAIARDGGEAGMSGAVVPLRRRELPSPRTLLTMALMRWIDLEYERQKRASEYAQAISDEKRDKALLKLLQIAEIDREQKAREIRIDALMQHVAQATLPAPEAG